MDWKEYKKKRFKEDLELKKEYDELELEYKIIGQIIDLRTEKKITQKQLAKLMNTKQPSIARFESGGYNPTLGFLYQEQDKR